MFVISEYIDNNKLGFELDKIKCKIIYDRSDYWNYLDNNRNHECENELLKRADLVINSSKFLYEDSLKYNKNCLLIENGTNDYIVPHSNDEKSVVYIGRSRKIDFDKFKYDEFKFNIWYHNIPGKKPCCGESVKLLKKEIKNINFDEYRYYFGLYKNTNILPNTISRDFYIHLYPSSEYEVVNVNNLPVNKEFENFVWSHGLDAYNDDDVFENAKNIVNNPTINISCSFYGDEVGDIGLYVQGDCRFASPYDVASWADRTEGSRFVYKYNCNDLLSKPEDIIEKYNIVEEDDHINTEGIISNIKIVGIWCGKYWSKYDELLNELKKLTGIKEITYI